MKRGTEFIDPVPMNWGASMADGNAAIWGAVRQVWPEAGEQRCWNHKMRNVLDRLPQREQSEAKDLLRAVVYAPSRAEAVKAREVFARRYRPWYPKAVDVLEDDWERMVAFYDFPEDHWKHLRTTNVVESPFAAVRLRTTAAKRFKRVESATALIWKLLSWWPRSGSEGSTLLTSSRTCLKEGSSKTESPSQPNSGRMPPDTFTHLLTQPRVEGKVCHPCVPGPTTVNSWSVTGRTRMWAAGYRQGVRTSPVRS